MSPPVIQFSETGHVLSVDEEVEQVASQLFRDNNRINWAMSQQSL